MNCKKIILYFCLSILSTAFFYFNRSKLSEIIEVRGNSLESILSNGSSLRFYEHYYKNHKVKRGDLIVYKKGEQKIIKIIKGLPGDQVSLVLNHKSWDLLINNKAVKNSDQKPYSFKFDKYKKLHESLVDFRGLIPDGNYLILGNIASGSYDSTEFGLVSKESLLGKAEPI